MHTSDQHSRVLRGVGYPDDAEAVINDFDKENCDTCLMEHEDNLAAIREFASTATLIEKVMSQYRAGILMPWEVTQRLTDLLAD